jgi:hypothetical protein
VERAVSYEMCSVCCGCWDCNDVTIGLSSSWARDLGCVQPAVIGKHSQLLNFRKQTRLWDYTESSANRTRGKETGTLEAISIEHTGPSGASKWPSTDRALGMQFKGTLALCKRKGF